MQTRSQAGTRRATEVGLARVLRYLCPAPWTGCWADTANHPRPRVSAEGPESAVVLLI